MFQKQNRNFNFNFSGFLILLCLLSIFSATQVSSESLEENYSGDISEEPIRQSKYRGSGSSSASSRVVGYTYPRPPPPPPTTPRPTKKPCKPHHHHPPEPACASIPLPKKVKTNYQEKEVSVPEFTRLPVKSPEFVPRPIPTFDFYPVPFPVVKYEINPRKNVSIDRWEVWPKEKEVKKRVPLFKNDTIHFNVYKLRPHKYMQTELRPRNIEVTEEVEQQVPVNYVDTQIEYETVWIEQEEIVFNDTFLDLVIYDYVNYDVTVEKIRYFDKEIPVDNYTLTEKRLRQRRLEYEEEREVEVDDIWYGKRPLYLPKYHVHHEQLLEERIQYTNKSFDVPVFEPYGVKVPVFTNYSVNVPRFYPVEITIPTYTKMPCAKNKYPGYLPPQMECPNCPSCCDKCADGGYEYVKPDVAFET